MFGNNSMNYWGTQETHPTFISRLNRSPVVMYPIELFSLMSFMFSGTYSAHGHKHMGGYRIKTCGTYSAHGRKHMGYRVKTCGTFSAHGQRYRVYRIKTCGTYSEHERRDMVY